MDALPRRTLLTATAAAAAALVSGCATERGSSEQVQAHPVAATGPGADGSPSAAPAAPPQRPERLIGDGSTADTGPQPHQPEPVRLTAGERPPQFVVFSWDGAGELDDKLFSRFRSLAKRHGASMTFFLSGIYTLPESRKSLYRPPQHSVGASDIGYLSDQHIHDTLVQLRAAWLDGHEIGTHFNGHFCGANGVGRWSPEEWDSEIEQAISFVTGWRTNTGFTDLPPLPFDYRKELVGGRTPCLEGQRALLPTAAARGWKYDASSPGGLQVWPQQVQGLWDFPLQSIPFPGHSFQVLSMDYNMMYNQSGADTKGDPSRHAVWKNQARDAYLAGFQRAYTTNRAPFFIGNHFERWNGGIYMDAVEEVLTAVAGQPEVRLVSFRQLVAWLEAQDQAVLRKLRTLGPGQAPAGGWEAFLGEASGGQPGAPSHRPSREPSRGEPGGPGGGEPGAGEPRKDAPGTAVPSGAASGAGAS